MHEQLVPTLWLKRLYGAECKPGGECYDIAFCEVPGYAPLYEIHADQALVPRSALQQLYDAVIDADEEGLASHSEPMQIVRAILQR